MTYIPRPVPPTGPAVVTAFIPDELHVRIILHVVTRERLASLTAASTPGERARVLASDAALRGWLRQCPVDLDEPQAPAQTPPVAAVAPGEGGGQETPEIATDDRDRWLTVPEAAKLARISESAVKKHLDGDGPIRGRQPRGKGTPWEVDPDSVTAYRAQEDKADQLRADVAAGRLRARNRPVAA